MSTSVYNILVVGAGGREHAIAHTLSLSPQCGKLFVAPGNGGTGVWTTPEPLNIKIADEVVAFCRKYNIDFVVVGPEQPLVDGLANVLQANGVPVVGPVQAGARLEGSKAFAKSFMQRYGIPTAAYRTFTKTESEQALTYLTQVNYPIVVKADGLAAGKGVFICQNVSEAFEAVTGFLSGRAFGAAGETLVIEEFLQGEELSVFVLTDGQSYKMLPTAKDHKRIGEGDTGLNTGGMGAISPAPAADDAFLKIVEEQVVKPTLEGLKAEGVAYKGFLFLGFMRVGQTPYLLEYNVRLGDPETETILPLLETDFVALMHAAANGLLAEAEVKVSTNSSVTVILASEGYPGEYQTGLPIQFPEHLPAGVTLFHAGTKTVGAETQTAGGRVLAVNAVAPTFDQARANAYAAANAIQFANRYFRRDIGLTKTE